MMTAAVLSSASWGLGVLYAHSYDRIKTESSFLHRRHGGAPQVWSPGATSGTAGTPPPRGSSTPRSGCPLPYSTVLSLNGTTPMMMFMSNDQCTVLDLNSAMAPAFVVYSVCLLKHSIWHAM